MGPNVYPFHFYKLLFTERFNTEILPGCRTMLPVINLKTFSILEVHQHIFLVLLDITRIMLPYIVYAYALSCHTAMRFSAHKTETFIKE